MLGLIWDQIVWNTYLQMSSADKVPVKVYVKLKYIGSTPTCHNL